MKKRSLVITAVLLGAGMFLASLVSAQEKKKAPEEEMMAMFAKYGTPGANHKLLDPLIGSWNLNFKSWMDPKAPVNESKGTSDASWILGGRYIMENVAGTMGQMPFKGMSITGYDIFKQAYNSLWMDEMSTSIMYSAGSADKDGKTFTFSGKSDNIMTGKKDEPYRMIMKIISPDQHVMEMFNPGPDGKEYKSMEVTYTRKK